MANHYPALSKLRKKLAANGPYIVTSFGLGVMWWAVLLAPAARACKITCSQEVSRGFLLTRSEVDIWGFVRVVGLVVVASLLFRSMPRSAWWKTCLSALACLWGGSSVFLLTATAQGASWWRLPISLLSCLIGALLFMAFAGYAVFPMTLLSAILLSHADRHSSG